MATRGQQQEAAHGTGRPPQDEVIHSWLRVVIFFEFSTLTFLYMLHSELPNNWYYVQSRMRPFPGK